MRRFTETQSALQAELVRTIRSALPVTRRADIALQSADCSHKGIAEVLVVLRHEFTGPDGTSPDLRGRSRAYRQIVREAYALAGAPDEGPIQKRLTSGVAYWVRKLLIGQYGENKLRLMGVLPEGSFASVSSGSYLDARLYDDPSECLSTVVSVLNRLATDPDFVPPEDVIRSAARAIALLQHKLTVANASVA